MRGTSLLLRLATALSLFLAGGVLQAQRVSVLPQATTPLTGVELVPIVQGAQTRRVSVGDIGTGLQTPPVGFAWNFAAHPLNIYRAPNGTYRTDLDPRAATPRIKAIFDGVAAGTTGVVYAQASVSNNTGDALTPATARQGLRSALSVCEADSSKSYCLVYARTGEYDRTRDFINYGGNQTGGTITKPTGLICYEGPCVLGPFQLGLTWAANGTYPTVYQTSRTLVGRVLNKVANDMYGDPNEFTLQTSIANVSACVAQDCRYNDGSIEYLKRADGAAPTDTNTRVLLQGGAVDLGGTNYTDFYMSGFTVYGGNSATVNALVAGTVAPGLTRDIVIEDSYLGYPYGVGANVFQIEKTTAFVGLFRVTGVKGNADVWNMHSSGNIGAVDMLMVDTVARDTGRTGSTSNNCATGHDGSAGAPLNRAIILNGSCWASAGRAVTYIGYSQAWVMNYSVDGDKGDTAFGGAARSTGYAVNDNAIEWLADDRSLRNLNSLATLSATSQIYVRRFNDGGGLRASAGGAISPY